MGLVLALAAVTLTGCHWLKSTETSKDQTGDLILDLGDKIKMRFIWIEPMDLFVGKYEVSNKIFRRFKPGHYSRQHNQMGLNRDDQPAVNVSWKDAQAFCQWLNKKYGVAGAKRYHFRLPKEAEWETYAACGQPVDYPWGTNWPPPNTWNYFGRENTEPTRKLDNNDGFRVSCPGPQSGKNIWRLFGVGGNVWEWCEDTDGESKARVFKGASWADCHPYFLKLTCRRSNTPDYRFTSLGFRVVADVTDINAGKQAPPKGPAAKVTPEAEPARQTTDNKEQTEAAKQEKKTGDQTLIQKLIEDKKFDPASTRLIQYEKDYGKDAFSDQGFAALDQTRTFDLSDAVTLECIRVKPLNIWMSKYEVTNKQFREFQPGHTSGVFKDQSLDDPDQPVVNVSWDDAMAFCQWLNTRLAEHLEAGRGFRLPTEAEWETAATCGQTRAYPWGNQWPPQYGNYGPIEGYDDGASVTCPVEKSGQNEWELYGMGGNVWEWCADLYDPSRQYRVIRGGAWNVSPADSLKVANRTGEPESRKNSYIGFRVVIGSKNEKGL